MIFLESVLVHIYVLEESVHDAQCVVTTQLQQESSVIINVSITMSANHILPYTSIVSNMCIEVSQKYRGFVSFNSSLGFTNLLHEFREQYT